MRVTIELDDDVMRAAVERETRESMRSGSYSGHVSRVIREAIASQFTTDLVRGIVDDAIRRIVRDYAEERVQEAIARMVRKVLAEQKATIAKQLEMPAARVGDEKGGG